VLSDEEAETQKNLRCPAIFETEPGLLPILIENAIGVGGAVRQPGAYPIADAVSARDIANVAQGLLTNSSSLSLDIIRAQASATGEQHMEIDAGGAMLATAILRPGDDIRFNAALPQFEAGGVLLTGEFGRPGLYSIRRGETLSQLIARAGGVTSLAYPYGAIFTRRSVKELQQEGFRRTGREMANALLAVSARKESSGDSIAAASNLIATLSTIEAPGRVVIEADPRVLAIRPDLDTVMNSGDAIYMPTRPNFVLALGDVSNPGALQFIAGKGVKEYISETGGTAATADSGRTFLVLPNGTAQPVRNSGRGIVVPPGSTIIVPKDIDPLFKLDVAANVAGILGNLITSVATIALLAK
jgi:protein involved in polysaccharide export with SLBB domain